MKPIFVTGIGTGVGKTLVSAVLAEALRADYWKPVQAGFDEGTDSGLVSSLVTNTETVIHRETYKLKLAASPHIAARQENIRIDLDLIKQDYESISKDRQLKTGRSLIIEGAGGLMVPLNEKEFVIDLAGKLDASMILVSRNYLGSINHSLMTAKLCKSYGLDVMGWVFNDNYMDYEKEIAEWSGYPALFSMPLMETVNRQSIYEMAGIARTVLKRLLPETFLAE